MIYLYNEDCVGGMYNHPNESADICITSPPYKLEDGFSYGLMHDCFSQVRRILKKNALLFVNFGHLAEDKFRPFTVSSLINLTGFHAQETITWVKNHYRPIQGKKRLNNLSEFIFMFDNGEMPDLDRLAIGVPYKDKSNAKRFAGGRDLKCRGNVWYINYETIQNKKDKLHNDRFPLELPETCLKLSGLKKGTVLEPFAGSGTTCIAAANLGLDCVAFEKNKNNFEIAVERIRKLNLPLTI